MGFLGAWRAAFVIFMTYFVQTSRGQNTFGAPWWHTQAPPPRFIPPTQPPLWPTTTAWWQTTTAAWWQTTTPAPWWATSRPTQPTPTTRPTPPPTTTRWTTTRRTTRRTTPRAVTRITAGTKAPVVNASVFDKPLCFSQPECTPHFKQRYSFVGGYCNNPVDRNRGRAGRPYKRLLPADYGDGKDTPRTDKKGQELPAARNISRTLNFDETQTRSSSISHMMPWWGQFMTHEFTKAPKGLKLSGAAYACGCDFPDPDGCHNIAIEKDDEKYLQDAETCIVMERTQVVPDPECDTSVREQQNGISSFLDGGLAYGNTESDMENLLKRHSTTGELVTGNYLDKFSDPGLPFQTQMDRDFGARMQCEVVVHKPPNKPCLMAGETRANENTGLSANHVLLLRLHNNVIKELRKMNPQWKKDVLVRETKAIVSAVFQQITYNEFLPIVISDKYMNRFNLNLLEKGYWYGYDASIDASLGNAFAAAAFRFGHTTITKRMTRPSPDWQRQEADPIRVKDAFFNNEPLLEKFQGDVNSILRGLTKDPTQHTGIKMVEDMREFLFAQSGKTGRDLFAINIQRGREHGVPGYNEFRQLCGLKRATGFFDMPEIPRSLQQQFASLYKHVDDIDLYIGGLAETAIDGGAVGPTYACILGYQFRDMRHGDKFWFENGGIFSSFSIDQVQSIRKYSLAGLMCDTMSDMRTIQPKPMLLHTVPGNARKFCSEHSSLDLEPWKDFRSTGPAREKDYEHDTEWTVWLPCVTSEGGVKSVATTLNDALKFRPDDVCREIIASETREVNSITQVRFECPRGTLKRTDYPYIDSGYEVYWTPWKDESTPGNQYWDDEEAPPSNDCKQPLAIQAQTLNEIPAGETGDVFESFGTMYGLVCRGSHQSSRACNDYRVRYLCRRENIKISGGPRKKQNFVAKSGNTDQKGRDDDRGRPKSDPNDLVWTLWTNNDSPTLEGDTELLERVADLPGFCKNPLYIDARTVDDTKVQASDSGDSLDQYSPTIGLICINDQQESKRCHDYEVRYLCRNGDLNAEEGPPSDVKAKAKQYCQSYGVCC